MHIRINEKFVLTDNGVDVIEVPDKWAELQRYQRLLSKMTGYDYIWLDIREGDLLVRRE